MTVKHIVFWKLAEEAGGTSRERNAERIREMLEALNGRIEGMRRLEVGVDFDRGDGAWDVALYSEFDSREALAAYQAHPDHVAAAGFIATVRTDRAVVDYET